MIRNLESSPGARVPAAGAASERSRAQARAGERRFVGRAGFYVQLLRPPVLAKS